MKNLRIGFIGAGGNTRARHLPGFQQISGVELVAVCNRSRESGEKVAREFGIPRVAENWTELIASPDIDAICIGTWPNLHAPITVAALQAGQHVLTEARMARNFSEATAMLTASAQHPALVAQIVPAPMSLAFDETVIGILKSGQLGAMREVIVTHTTDSLANDSSLLTWRQNGELSGKNTLVMGIYYEIILRWLGGGVTTLVADAGLYTGERRNETGAMKSVDIPDNVTILGRYADGARLIAHFSGVERTAPRNEIRLNGSLAGLRLDLLRNELWLTRAGEKETLLEIAPEKLGRWRVEADFIDSIREGRPVTRTDFRTGLEYMRFTDAVWASWNANGRRVELSEISA